MTGAMNLVGPLMALLLLFSADLTGVVYEQVLQKLRAHSAGKETSTLVTRDYPCLRELT